MTSRWLQLTVVSLMLLSAVARADLLTKAAAKHQEIDNYLRKPYVSKKSREFPQFGCYQLGRLQGVSDRLGHDISQLELQASNLSDGQFKRLQLASEYYRGLEAQLADAIAGKGCDPDAAKQLPLLNVKGGPPLRLLKKAVDSTRTISAQDQVIRCFYLGRLSTLNERMGDDIRDQLRAGKIVAPEATELYRRVKTSLESTAPGCLKGEPALDV